MGRGSGVGGRRRAPGEQARLEASEFQGHGKTELAAVRRQRRINRLLMRGYSVAAIAQQTGLRLALVEKDVADLARRQAERVSAFEARGDAAEQLARFDEARIMILEDIAALDAQHPNRPRLWGELIKLEQTLHVFLERTGLRKPIDQSGPPDASDLRGKPTHLIEAEMARIARQLYERVDPTAYARAVEEMRRGDVIDVPALPAAETDDAGPGGDDGDDGDG